MDKLEVIIKRLEADIQRLVRSKFLHLTQIPIAGPTRSNDIVPRYMLDEAEYIRTFGYSH